RAASPVGELPAARLLGRVRRQGRARTNVPGAGRHPDPTREGGHRDQERDARSDSPPSADRAGRGARGPDRAADRGRVAGGPGAGRCRAGTPADLRDGDRMSTIETTDEFAVERVTFVRSFELPLADAWDGRTLDVRVVPYNVPTTRDDPPRFTPYRESFLRGAFEKQLTTPGRDRVCLNVEHEQGFRGAIGRSLKFSDHEDGLHGSFGVLENADGDKALSLIRDGFLTGLSLEF